MIIFAPGHVILCSFWMNIVRIFCGCLLWLLVWYTPWSSRCSHSMLDYWVSMTLSALFCRWRSYCLIVLSGCVFLLKDPTPPFHSVSCFSVDKVCRIGSFFQSASVCCCMSALCSVKFFSVSASTSRCCESARSWQDLTFPGVTSPFALICPIRTVGAIFVVRCFLVICLLIFLSFLFFPPCFGCMYRVSFCPGYRQWCPCLFGRGAE